MLRIVSALTFVLFLGLGIYGVVRYWTWLDNHHVSGVAIIGLLMGTMFIFGMTVQTASDLGNKANPGKVFKRFLQYGLQMIIFLPLFLGPIAGLVILTWRYLTPLVGHGLAALVFILAFLFYIRLAIFVLTRLADKEIIGPRY